MFCMSMRLILCTIIHYMNMRMSKSACPAVCIYVQLLKIRFKRIILILCIKCICMHIMLQYDALFTVICTCTIYCIDIVD